MSFTRFRLIAWALLLFGLFIVLINVFNTTILLVVLNGIFLGIIVAVTIVYFPLIWHTFVKGTFDRVSQLSVGICLLWFTMGVQRLWSLYFRYNGAPQSMLDSPVFAFVAYLAIISGILFVSAPGYPAEATGIPVNFWTGNKKLLFFFAGLGGSITFILSLYYGIRF